MYIIVKRPLHFSVTLTYTSQLSSPIEMMLATNHPLWKWYGKVMKAINFAITHSITAKHHGTWWHNITFQDSLTAMNEMVQTVTLKVMSPLQNCPFMCHELARYKIDLTCNGIPCRLPRELHTCVNNGPLEVLIMKLRYTFFEQGQLGVWGYIGVKLIVLGVRK